MSSSSTTSQDDAKRPTNPPTELKFFLFSDPSAAKSRDNKRLVRSHVARTSHAKSRHAREIEREMTLGKPQESEPGDELLAAGEELVPSSVGQALPSPTSTSMPSSWIASQNSPVDFPTHPLALVDPGIRDQIQASVQQLSPWEQFLFDHCTSITCFVPRSRPSQIADKGKLQLSPSLSPADMTPAISPIIPLIPHCISKA